MVALMLVTTMRARRQARWGVRGTDEGMVDCLDLIRDLGDQFDDALLISVSRDGGPLRHLYNVLWRDEERIIDAEQVAEAARRAVSRVSALATWNPDAVAG